MRKIVTILIITLVLSFPTTAFAETPSKEAEVSVSNIPDIINVGESIELSAVTVKQGSSYEEKWNGATAEGTVFDENTNEYISKAVFYAEKPGTYVINYQIKMRAGNSNSYFTGTVEKTIKVINSVSVKGAAIRNLVFNETDSDGSISGYSVQGRTYILWSDGSATPYGSIFFFMRADEISKDIRVSFTVESKEYSYLVTVDR
ncbi:MAG: hypothetical protein APF76_00150 [Desulfitibacter sp. BRH_c19]|nr:MAG: hypothetical protein APF76_00150 [Desulfitibacter sp. BRH_c19]